MAKVTYKNLPNENTEFIEIDKEYLIWCACEYARKSKSALYDLIMKEKVCLQVNGDIIHPDDWFITTVSPQDKVVIYPVLQGDFMSDAGGFLMVALGAILFIAAPYLAPAYISATTASIMQGVGISLALGGISNILFQPDLPSMPGFAGSGGKSTQTYNWSGIRTAARNDTTVPVVYGTHPVGGNLISVFTEGINEDNYLYMLISLCEGEIDGICKHNDYTSICSTSDQTSGSYSSPAIKLDDQPLHIYNNVEWWYRKGTNLKDATKDVHDPTAQNKIPHFDGARVQNDDGRELTTDGVIYTTTKDIDMVNIQLHAPALYESAGGTTKAITSEYKIEFKTEVEGSYHTYLTPKNSPVVSAVVGNVNNCTVEFDTGDGYHYGAVLAEGYTIRIISNSFPTTPTANITGDIKFEVINTTTNISEIRTIEIMSDDGRWELGYGHAPVWVYNYSGNKVQIGLYTVELSRHVSVGDKFTISRTVEDSNEWGAIIGKTKTGIWSSILLDFDNITNGSGRDVYMLRVSRRFEASDELTKEDKITLHSITEIVNGEFIYPNTALLGLKIKATDQLSGSIPNVLTVVRGTKIEVPSTAGGAETFENLWYDDTQSRFENSSGAERTWDEVSWTEQFSDNSMLCVRDLLLNTRYGLGLHINNTDLYSSGIISTLKKCHVSYDPYSTNQPDYMSWYNGGQDSKWSENWKYTEGVGTVSSDKATRTIAASGHSVHYFESRLLLPLNTHGTYTFSITLSGLSSACDIQLYSGKWNTVSTTSKVIGSTNNKTDGTHTITNISPTMKGQDSIGVRIRNVSVDSDLSLSITDMSLNSTIAEHYHTFDGVLESEQAALTALLEMCNSFRCWPVWFNGQFNFILDEDETAIHTLSMGNIIENSFTQSFTPLSEIPYRLFGQYTDEDINFNMKSLIAVSGRTDLTKANKRTIGLKGITNRQKAERELIYRLNKATECDRVVAFKCGIDAIHATAGDIINLQHDLPAWGQGGRVLSFDSVGKSITIDKEFPFTDTNATYIIKYQSRENQFFTATVNATGTKQTFNVENWPSSDPTKDAVYQIGRVGTYSKPYRLITVSRTKDQEVEVAALVHATNVYTATIAIQEDRHSEILNTLIPPKAPRNISIRSSDVGSGIGFVISALAPLSSPHVLGIVVQMSVGGEDWEFETIGEIPKGKNSIVYINENLELDKTYRFKLYCRTANTNGDPVYVDYFLTKQAFLLQPPTGIKIKDSSPLSHIWDGKDVTVQWNTVGINTYTNNLFDKYVVEIYHTSYASSNLVRTSYTNTTEFMYTYDMNLEDSGENTPHGTLIFAIYTLATNGVLSNPSTPFLINNAPPPSPQGLTTEPWMKSIKFIWNVFTGTDLKEYQYRTKIEDKDGTPTSSWSSWTTTSQTSAFRTVTESEQDTYGVGTRIYIEVKTIDLYNNESSVSSIDAYALYIGTVTEDIKDFAITAEKTYVNMPLVQNDVWSDATPGANDITWNEHNLVYNGTQYTISSGNTDLKYIYWADGNTSYTATSINDLTPNTDFHIAINLSGAHNIAWNVMAKQIVSTNYLEDDCVVATKIFKGAVSTIKLSDECVVASKIFKGAVSTIKLFDECVVASKLGTDSVITAKINNLAITTAKINNAAVNSAKIGNLAVTNAKIGNAAVETAKINNLAITTAKINNAAVNSAKIGNASIRTANIRDAAVETAKINNLAVVTAKIGNAAVNSAKIGNASIREVAIHDAAVTNAKIGNLAVTNAKINDLDAGKINTGYLAAARISADTITAAMINVTNLAAIKADLGTITAGTITLDSSGFIRSNGKDNFADATAGFFLGYDTDAYKLNIGDANYYMKWNGTNLVTRTLLDDVSAGDYITVNANMEIPIGPGAGGAYIKYKEVYTPAGGTLRISFDVRDGGSSDSVSSYIYRNGVEVGTHRLTTTDTWTNYSEDISGWTAGDKIQLYIRFINAVDTAYCRNLKVGIDYPQGWGINLDDIS